MKYVDGYVLPVPKKNLAAYRQMAAKAAKIWRKYSALEFRECVGDDLKTIKVRSFPGLVKPKRGDRVNDNVMKDPRLAKMMDMKAMPFDSKRMAYGGFEVMVDV